MPVSNSFGNQAPYQYYDNTDPASRYNADGSLKVNGLANTAVDTGFKIAGEVPIFGQAAAAAHSIGKALNDTNTKAGNFTAGLIDPFTEATHTWGDIHGSDSAGVKARKAFNGFADAIIPGWGAVDSLIQGNKRRAEEANYQDQQNYYKNAGYDYALNNNGINYSQNLRPVNNTNQPKQMVGAQAALAGLGTAGGDLLKQLLAKHQTKVPTSLNDFSTEYRKQLPQTDPSATDRTQLPFGAVPPAPPIQITPPTGDDAMQGNGSDPSTQGGNILSGLGKGLGILGESGGGGADIGSSLGDDFGSLPMGFENGGVAHVKGGNGGDDIALVHAGTGKDTGIRVEKGEMIVFSDENVKALNDAVKSGDKEKAFSLIADQLSKGGKQMGTTNYSDGGKGTTDNTPDISKLSDEQLAALYNERLPISGEIHGDNSLGEKVKKEFDGRGLKKYYPNGYSLLATPTYTSTKTGKEFKPDENFDFGKWKSGQSNPHIISQGVHDRENKLADALGQDYGGSLKDPNYGRLPSDHPAIAALTGQSYPNGQSKVKDNKDGTHTVLDVNGNPVTSPIGPQQYTGYDENGNPLGPYDPNRKAPVAPLKSNTVVGADINNKEPYDWASALNYGTDAAKFAVGMVGAQTPLPTWQVPGAWTDYSNHMKYLSNTGLSAADKALARNNADNTYLTSLERNRNIGGGNAGTIIAADNMANVNHNRAALELASADHQANLRNLGAYGGVVQQDLNNTRTMYNDEYSKAMMAKQSGAALANKAQDDAAQQLQVDKYYGANSDYAKLMQIELEQKQAALDAQKSNNTVNLNRDGSKTPSTSTGDSATDNYIAVQKYLLTNKDKKLYTQNADGSYAAINQ